MEAPTMHSEVQNRPDSFSHRPTHAQHVLIQLLLLALALPVLTACTDNQTEAGKATDEDSLIPVQASVVERGAIARQRSFTGTLEADAQLLVAPKISGRIERLHVDLADTVERDMLIVELDDAEYIQSVNRAEAERAVAKANLAEAKSLLEISERELKRISELRKRQMSSESQFDLASIDRLNKLNHVDVTRAQLAQAEAALESERIRLGYTRIRANWDTTETTRVVAEKWVEEGETVSENTPLLRIISLDPITAVFHVTERDYAHLKSGQIAQLSSDVYPGLVFPGEIIRIAPIFRENTRQARIELRAENPDMKLKPGMFVRVNIELERDDDAVIVPEQALTRRNDVTGVFVLPATHTTRHGGSVKWVPVKTGIRQGDRIQIVSPALSGRVVTLGQQQLDDGTRVSLPADIAGQGSASNASPAGDQP